MSGKSIIIIGCGIAGPVLAMLLKYKGFDPVIYERQPEEHAVGVAIGLTPQTLKVLNILGLAESLIPLGATPEDMVTYSETRGEILGQTNFPSRFRAMFGWPMLLISRSVYHTFLYENARKRGIDAHFSKKLVGVNEEVAKVTAVFEDGTKAEGDLLVGCDGLHSAVRNTLFGKDEVMYTGLVQIAGFAEMPKSFKAHPHGIQGFDDGVHFMTAPISASQMVWVTSLREPTESREDWRRLSIDDARGIIKALPTADWGLGIKDVIAGATFVTRYGLYERPIAGTWHKGRVVLVGDAAHPTSPHLGQGANQAMEDCYHLVRLLCKAEPFNDASLEAAFEEYERIRLPIVTKSVGQAKKEGEKRVMSGKEACKKRDEMLKGGGGHDPERWKLQMELMQGPFMGESEI